MLPSAAELEYFIEVSTTLNLSRASERLGISQPSLSLAVKRLESSVGTELFVRHKHGVSLTQAGKQLVLHARQLLQYWEATKSHALASQQEVQGYFTLGCHSSVAVYMVSGFLATLLENHPKLEIHLKNDISRNITERVINSSIDIGIVINPFRHPDLIIRKLCDDEVTFWVGEGSKKIQDIHSQQSVILCDPNLTQTQSLLKKCKKAGLASERIITMDSLEVVASLTANGCGIGILPTRIANAIPSYKLKRVPKMPVYSDELCLIYRNENRNVQAIQKIANTIKAFYTK
jgi:DNA-binding transcriptional LysR family regulator